MCGLILKCCFLACAKTYFYTDMFHLNIGFTQSHVRANLWMCVCMHVRMHVCMCVCVCVCVWVWLYLCFVYMFVGLELYTCVCVQVVFVYVCVCFFECTFVCIVYVCMFRCVCVCVCSMTWTSVCLPLSQVFPQGTVAQEDPDTGPTDSPPYDEQTTTRESMPTCCWIAADS